MAYQGGDSDKDDESLSFKRLAARSYYQRGIDIRKMGCDELSEHITQGEARQAELVIKIEERRQLNEAAAIALQERAQRTGNTSVQLFMIGVANSALHIGARAGILALLAYGSVRAYRKFNLEAESVTYRTQTLTQYERDLELTGAVLHDLRVQLRAVQRKPPVPANGRVSGWTAAATAALPDLGRTPARLTAPFRRGGAVHGLLQTVVSALPVRRARL